MDKLLIINRIKEYKKFKSDKDLSEFLGVTPQTLSTWKSRNSIDYELIFAKCEEVSPTWLITGEGSVLLEEKVHGLVSFNQSNEKRYPLVYPKAVGGFSGTDFKIEERDIKEYYVVPKFKHKKIDFMIEVDGSSMYPKYNSGDIVACRIINEERYIQWNKTHVVASKDQGLLIKRIKKGPEGSLTMISDNENYDPFDVPIDDIDGVALVVGVIRLE